MLRECDYSQALLEQVNQAISDKTPLVIQGSNSKAFLGRPVTGQTLDVRCHRGIVNYDPTELVITARAGTPLVAIEAALESAGQMLPCEPPHYGEEATWGGMVACGLAGPRRPWSGSVRDFVLGTRIITGAGKHLRFGGEVMKNVAGYDLSRLMAGSYGCLGVLTEISMKVLPRPRASLSLRREISLQEAMNEIAQWQLQPLPISGLCYFDNALWIRLEGGEGSVKAARELLGGEEVAGQFWQQLREQQLPFFSLPGTLWRISLPSDAPMMDLPGEQLIDWGGALRWLKSTAEDNQIHRIARNNIDAWWPAIEAGAEAILQTASGCGAFVKEYGQMLKNDALYADKARQVSELAVDLVELLREEPLEKLAVRGDKKLAFHCPCTLQHAQKLNGEVEKVLLRLGFTLTDVPDSHLCCGSAGTYALTHPDLARQLRDNKMNALESGKPEMIVTANIGCQTHLASAGRTSVRHWIEIVEQALEKE